jgi:hypothetical protein
LSAATADEVAAAFLKFGEVVAPIISAGASWRANPTGGAGTPCITVRPSGDVGFGLRISDDGATLRGMGGRIYHIDGTDEPRAHNESFLRELLRRLTTAAWSREDIFSKPQSSWKQNRK